MAVSLDSHALRAIAEHLDLLTMSSNRNCVLSADDQPDSITMPGWSHSLQVERAKVDPPAEGDNQAEVYRLVVGSAY